MYIIEGTIGAGKSTLLKLLANAMPEITVSFEPLHQWQSEGSGTSLLTHFYQDPHRWAYTMETATMLSRVREHRYDQIRPDTGQLLVERSIYSGHYCFALNSYQSGFMTDLEWRLYESLFTFLIPGRCLPPQGFIYLRVSPQVAHQRIAKRKRDGETISLAYLHDIAGRHDQFLLERMAILPELRTVPTLVLDGDVDFEYDAAALEEYVQKIRAFMQQMPQRKEKACVLQP